jgi:peptidoglycan/LPS O-acetylase OafA/YrhL
MVRGGVSAAGFPRPPEDVVRPEKMAAMHSADGGQRHDFKFADGLRAVAALSVALFHTFVFTGLRGDTDGLPAIAKSWRVGNFGVPVFIVLSGFVLALPIVGSSGLVLRKGWQHFIKRRARRILPPYLISFALFLALIAAVPWMHEESGTAWDNKIPVTLGGVVSHLFAVHNLRHDWIYQVNGPAWSVATEWQLYFTLPFLLLPLWRRTHVAVMVAAAVAIGWAIHFVDPHLDAAHFWFLGLFAMGAAAAHLVVRETTIRLLGPIVAVGLLATFAGVLLAHDAAREQDWLTETVLGAFVALGLVWLGQRSLAGSTTPVHRVLESRLLVWIGLWSYSLYLVHSPLLALGNFALLELDPSFRVHYVLMFVAVLPCSLTIAYLFHRAVERRFMTSHQQAVRVPVA